MMPEIDENMILLISASLQVVMLSVLLTLSLKLIKESGRQLSAVFLSFCYTLWLLSGIYWVIYDLMRPDRRMPFAANEIGEAASILMMAATINASIPHGVKRSCLRIAVTLIFAACNIVLWIAWSGEWVEDIFIGAVFTWFLYSISNALEESGAFKNREWIILFFLCLLLILSQALTFAIAPELRMVPDLSAYLILLLGVIFLLYKVIHEYRSGSRDAVLLSLSFALVSWVIMGKYMSAGYWYTLFLVLETVFLPLWYLTVRKAVREV